MGFGIEKLNYHYYKGFAHTEDGVLIYNLFVHHIPIRATVADLEKYFSEFGIVVKCTIFVNQKGSKKAQFKMGFVNYARPDSASHALYTGRHTLLGEEITVIACDTWRQPKPDEKRLLEHKYGGATNIGPSPSCSDANIGALMRLMQKSPSNKTDGISYADSLLCDEQTLTKDKTANTANAAVAAALQQQVQSSSSYYEVNKERNILCLNSDCLYEILEKLSMCDQINFVRTSQIFIAIYQSFFEHKFKHLHLVAFEGMTLNNIREFFMIMGEGVCSISGCMDFCNRDRVLELIGNFCPNLQKFELNNTSIKKYAYRNFFHKVKNSLVTLKLVDCNIYDKFIDLLYCLRKLEVLDLSDNSDISGNTLCKLTQVKVLNLNRCRNLESSSFIQLCRDLKGLTYVNVKQCDRLGPLAYEELVRNGHQLETLYMSNLSVKYENFAHMPKLKHIIIQSNSPIMKLKDEFFQSMAQFKKDQIESLCLITMSTLELSSCLYIAQLKSLKKLAIPLNSRVNDNALGELSTLSELEELDIKGCHSITNLGLIQFFRSCKKLTCLNIQQNLNLTNQFVLDAIRIVAKRRPKERAKLIHIFAKHTNINSEIMADDLYKEYRAHLRVFFNQTPSQFGFEEFQQLDIFGIYELGDRPISDVLEMDVDDAGHEGIFGSIPEDEFDIKIWIEENFHIRF